MFRISQLFSVLLVWFSLSFSTITTTSNQNQVLAQATSKTIYTTVKENQAHFSTVASKVYFTWYLKSGIVNMTLGNTNALDPVTVSNMYTSIGTIKVSNVVEVNDTHTNLYLEFSNAAAAVTVLNSVNIGSWNAVKKCGIVLATDQAPVTPTAEPRTVLFGGIIAIATIFSAAVSAFVVRRMALNKIAKKNKSNKDMANLEAQLVKEQIRSMGGSEKLLSSRNNKKFLKQDAVAAAADPYSADEMQEFPEANGDDGPTANRTSSSSVAMVMMMPSSSSNRTGGSVFDSRSQRSGVSRKSNATKASAATTNQQKKKSRSRRDEDEEEDGESRDGDERDEYSNYNDGSESNYKSSSRAPTDARSAKSERSNFQKNKNKSDSRRRN